MELGILRSCYQQGVSCMLPGIHYSEWIYPFPICTSSFQAGLKRFQLSPILLTEQPTGRNTTETFFCGSSRILFSGRICCTIFTFLCPISAYGRRKVVVPRIYTFTARTATCALPPGSNTPGASYSGLHHWHCYLPALGTITVWMDVNVSLYCFPTRLFTIPPHTFFFMAWPNSSIPSVHGLSFFFCPHTGAVTTSSFNLCCSGDSWHLPGRLLTSSKPGYNFPGLGCVLGRSLHPLCILAGTGCVPANFTILFLTHEGGGGCFQQPCDWIQSSDCRLRPCQ